MDHIEYRTETEAPIIGGWYWGVPRFFKAMDPRPLFVWPEDGGLAVILDDGAYDDPSEYRWFGPVTMVKESGAE